MEYLKIRILLTTCLEMMQIAVKMNFSLDCKTEQCTFVLIGDCTLSSCIVMGEVSSGPSFDFKMKLVTTIIYFYMSCISFLKF